MAKLTRKHQKIFCDVSPTGALGVFGSYEAGSPAYSDDPDTMQSLTAYGAGWAAALVNNAPPAIQDFDGLCNLITRQIAYCLQTGIPEYSSSVTYYIGSIINDGASALYVSVADANINNALSDTTKWMLFKSKKVRYLDVNDQISAYDDYMIDFNGTYFTYPCSFYLPEAISTNNGRVIMIKSRNQYGLTVYSLGGLIDGQESKFIAQYECRSFISTGTTWEIII